MLDLKALRQARGYTLEEVARRLRIRREYLLALENNDDDVLPSPAHKRLFLRTYAKFLGCSDHLDPSAHVSPVINPGGKRLSCEPAATFKKFGFLIFVSAIIIFSIPITFYLWNHRLQSAKPSPRSLPHHQAYHADLPHNAEPTTFPTWQIKVPQNGFLRIVDNDHILFSGRVRAGDIIYIYTQHFVIISPDIQPETIAVIPFKADADRNKNPGRPLTE